MAQLVVKHHRPYRPWLLIGLLAALFAGAVWGAFVYGQWRAGYDRLAAAGLRASVEDLSRKNSALREQITALQREREVDRAARAEVQQSLDALQNKITGLQEELQFYKGIVSPAAGEEGVRVQSLKFTNGGAPRLYHYRLVLLQVRTKEFRIAGRVDLRIYGAEGGKPVILDARDLVPRGGSARLDFAFQYFQNLEGDALFPQGFAPGRVEVTIHENGRDPVRQNFDWQSVSG